MYRKIHLPSIRLFHTRYGELSIGDTSEITNINFSWEKVIWEQSYSDLTFWILVAPGPGCTCRLIIYQPQWTSRNSIIWQQNNIKSAIFGKIYSISMIWGGRTTRGRNQITSLDSETSTAWVFATQDWLGPLERPQKAMGRRISVLCPHCYSLLNFTHSW